jgi:hypothetical protein
MPRRTFASKAKVALIRRATSPKNWTLKSGLSIRVSETRYLFKLAERQSSCNRSLAAGAWNDWMDKLVHLNFRVLLNCKKAARQTHLTN